jgi:hypothetical protein
MYTFKIHRPGSPLGAELQIAGLGIFENGKQYTISKEDADAFRVAHQTIVATSDPADGTLTAAAEIGPTLLQAFKNDPDVTVATVKADKPKEADKPDKAEAPEKADEPEQDTPTVENVEQDNTSSVDATDDITKEGE